MDKPVRKSKKAKPLPGDRSIQGFAAFLDLRDSTYVWNQNPDLAERALTRLADTVSAATKTWQGLIGNFTGDGFLLVFPQAEYAVRGLAAMVEAWEPHRKHFGEELAELGAPLPDERSLMLRTGIAHGHYRSSRGAGRKDVAGEAINRASRCEGASKVHFEADISGGTVAPQQRIFVTQDVFNLIESKTDYWYSGMLRVEFKGYERPTSSGLASSADHIVAMWPKAARPAAQVAVVPAQRLQRAARGASKVDVADRLVEAARRVEVADSLSQAARGSLGRPAREVLLRAISIYRDSLGLLPVNESPARWAGIQCNLGAALSDLAVLLAGPERAARLAEAVSAYREALKVRTLGSSPADYAMTQNNLGLALGTQAGLLAGPARAARLTQAVSAYCKALKVYTLESSPADYAATLNNLGTALGDQAELLAGSERVVRLAEAKATYIEALQVFTEADFPRQHQLVTRNLERLSRLFNG